MATMTAEERAALVSALGLSPHFNRADLTAVTEQLRAGHPLAHTLPPGVVNIDATKLEELRVAARRGEEIAEAQRVAAVAATVEAAVRDGRIPPAARKGWVASLTNDPGGSSAAHLARMARGLVPYAEVGYLADDDAPVSDDEDERDLARLRNQPAYKNWAL